MVSVPFEKRGKGGGLTDADFSENVTSIHEIYAVLTSVITPGLLDRYGFCGCLLFSEDRCDSTDAELESGESGEVLLALN